MKKNKEEIFDFWEKTGVSKPPGNLVTHKDINQVQIE
ncbi:unnamed protein product, partial [marine sediment metagenome]